jgi:hypothetical protein
MVTAHKTLEMSFAAIVVSSNPAAKVESFPFQWTIDLMVGSSKQMLHS